MNKHKNNKDEVFNMTLEEKLSILDKIINDPKTYLLDRMDAINVRKLVVEVEKEKQHSTKG